MNRHTYFSDIQKTLVNNAVMLSDPMSMFETVQTVYVRRQRMGFVRSLRLQCVTFMFVPGDEGIRGNERADRLASRASVVWGRAMDRAILNANKDTYRNEFLGRDLDSTCEAATVASNTGWCFAGSIRSLINQHGFRIVSRHILTEILKRRSTPKGLVSRALYYLSVNN